jgi:hypothetical protein
MRASMLHITNGDAAARLLRDAGLPGRVLAWRDVLHDGAVPGGLTLEALSKVRASELARLGHGSFESIRAEFARRDEVLEQSTNLGEIVLWFEHDLYDQLQLLQLLEWAADPERRRTPWSLVQLGPYPDGPAFHGLAELHTGVIRQLSACRQPVTNAQLELGRRAWRAFTSEDPTALAVMARERHDALPFLGVAVVRLLQEFPSRGAGLSRTELQLVRAGERGTLHRADYYRRSQATEWAPWGDRSVFIRLEGLTDVDPPALDRLGPDLFGINDLGRRLLTGEVDWLRLRSGIDIRIGGVTIRSADGWRWDETRDQLSASASS